MSLDLLAPVETAPVVSPVVIEIPSTPAQEHLAKMIQLVKDGRWCRNRQLDKLDRSCALGMIFRYPVG